MAAPLLGLRKAGQLQAKTFQILSPGDTVLAAGLKTVSCSRPSVAMRGPSTENLWSHVTWEGVSRTYVCMWGGGRSGQMGGLQQ